MCGIRIKKINRKLKVSRNHTSMGCALLNAIISARERTGVYDKSDK